MPQWRKLHTKTIDSLDLNDMPDDFTRLLWVLLPLQLDRCGRGLDNPAWVRSKVFPLREDVSVERVAEAFDWYASRGMIERYEVDGRNYFWVPTWHKYQGNTTREADSDYPAPKSYSDPYNKKTKHKPKSRATHDQLKTNSSSDADADADSDSDADADGSSHNPFSLYEQATASTLTPILADKIGGLVDECEKHRKRLPSEASGAALSGEAWVSEAIREAAESTNKFGLRYVMAILDRWQKEGYGGELRNNGKGPPGVRRLRIRNPHTGELEEVEAIT